MTDDTTASDLDLTSPYEPGMVYYRDADAAEYLLKDGACYYDEVAPGVALVRDMDSREVIGFRIANPKAWAEQVTREGA